jgi:hypothetical protein
VNIFSLELMEVVGAVTVGGHVSVNGVLNSNGRVFRVLYDCRNVNEMKGMRRTDNDYDQPWGSSKCTFLIIVNNIPL